MDTLSLDISSMEEKDDQQMITLVDTSHLDEGELVDNSVPLVHHVLESSDFSKNIITQKCHSNTHCLICNAKFGVSGRGSMQIFSDEVKTTSRHMNLVLVLSGIVNRELDESTIHSSIICKKCFKLLDDIDSIEGQLINLKQEVNNKFFRTEALVQLEKNGIVPMFKEELLPNESRVTKNDKEFKITSKVRGRRGRRGRGRGRPPPFVKLEVKEELDEVLTSFNFQEGQNVSVSLEGETEEDGFEGTRNILVSDESGEVKLDAEDVFEVDGLDLNNEENTIQIGGMLLPTISSEMASKEVFPQEDSDVISENKTTTAKYRCRFCLLRLQSFSDVQNHLIQFHSDRLFECEVCEQRLESQPQLLEHLEQHLVSGEKPYSCRLCPRRYSLPRQLKEHVRHHLSKTIPCYQCPKRFRTEGALQEHMNTHTGYRPYACEQCHKRFTSKHILKTHMRTHGARNRPHKCKVCQKHFLTAHHLNDHMQIHQNRKDYICETCGKAFSTQRSLDLHSITHSGIKNFICSICFKAFARKGEVEDHERIHTGEKPFQCEICGATFSQRSNLQSHKRATHYEEKKYRCTDCNKAFKRRRLLVYHIMSVHTGERPYKCNFCSSAFVYPEHFKKHLRIHTGEKPFKCEICGKAFNSRDNKNAHKFIHSEKKQYECTLCGVGFMRKPQLMLHIQQHDCTTDNIEAYIKVNSSSIVDAELSETRAIPSPAALVMKGDEEQSMEATLDEHMQLVRATGESQSVEVIQRPIQIVDPDEVPRYIIHKAGDNKSDDAVGHFLASLQGQVVEVRADDLERYTEITADQISQMAQVAAQVVATQSNGNAQLQQDASDFRLFQIQLEGDKEEVECHPAGTIITTEDLSAKDDARQAPGATFKKITQLSPGGTLRQVRAWPQSNEDVCGGS
ncbi:UNVERIFIED_CONTAM: hypothetical protein GTU68_000704 [Idotea baltica]|nr:hypothetical protein [Idotea baltica]